MRLILIFTFSLIMFSSQSSYAGGQRALVCKNKMHPGIEAIISNKDGGGFLGTAIVHSESQTFDVNGTLEDASADLGGMAIVYQDALSSFFLIVYPGAELNGMIPAKFTANVGASVVSVELACASE